MLPPEYRDFLYAKSNVSTHPVSVSNIRFDNNMSGLNVVVRHADGISSSEYLVLNYTKSTNGVTTASSNLNNVQKSSPASSQHELKDVSAHKRYKSYRLRTVLCECGDSHLCPSMKESSVALKDIHHQTTNERQISSIETTRDLPRPNILNASVDSSTNETTDQTTLVPTPNCTSITSQVSNSPNAPPIRRYSKLSPSPSAEVKVRSPDGSGKSASITLSSVKQSHQDNRNGKRPDVHFNIMQCTTSTPRPASLIESTIPSSDSGSCVDSINKYGHHFKCSFSGKTYVTFQQPQMEPCNDVGNSQRKRPRVDSNVQFSDSTTSSGPTDMENEEHDECDPFYGFPDQSSADQNKEREVFVNRCHPQCPHAHLPPKEESAQILLKDDQIPNAGSPNSPIQQKKANAAESQLSRNTTVYRNKRR